MSRLDDIRRFYAVLESRSRIGGGLRKLGDADGLQNLPQRDVYFFFEESEFRSDSGAGLRVVRIGTHALKPGVCAGLKPRLFAADLSDSEIRFFFPIL